MTTKKMQCSLQSIDNSGDVARLCGIMSIVTNKTHYHMYINMHMCMHMHTRTQTYAHTHTSNIFDGMVHKCYIIGNC